MLRNHPALAIWCGGNEIRPPADILKALRDTLLPTLDGTRFFLEYSNDDSMSYHSGDGPYTIQPDTSFWTHRSFPFNSEVGSVGIGDYESLKRVIPERNLTVPFYDTASKKWKVDSVWQYHKYIGYDSVIEAYGHPSGIKDFAMKAQLVNYNQYRSLIEGFSAHMWDWYTGVIIWKTQNPWTAMLGQMYDVYLDPNACLFGLREGSKPLHIMYDPVAGSAIVVNNHFSEADHLRITATVYDCKGHKKIIAQSVLNAPACGITNCSVFKKKLTAMSKKKGAFLSLSLYDTEKDTLLDENLYWLPDKNGTYSGLAGMPKATIIASQKMVSKGVMEVTLENPAAGPLAFFIRVSLVDPETNERILPVFCNNNYISVPPGQQRVVTVEFTPRDGVAPTAVLEGWNLDRKNVIIR